MRNGNLPSFGQVTILSGQVKLMLILILKITFVARFMFHTTYVAKIILNQKTTQLFNVQFFCNSSAPQFGKT